MLFGEPENLPRWKPGWCRVARPCKRAVYSLVIDMIMRLSMLAMRRKAGKNGKQLPIQQALV
jgi:hypothetical protein